MPQTAHPEPLAELLRKIATLCPTAEIKTEPGGDQAGNVWLDIKKNKIHITAEWRPDQGLGIYQPGASAYGDAPQEVFRNMSVAANRIRHLLGASSRRFGLSAVRRLSGLSQEEIARRMGINQGAVSRMEGRQNVEVDSLAKAIHAMGGKIEIRVHFDDFEMPLWPAAEEPERTTKAKKAAHA